jgi:uncharacterized protein YdbL (DUF1318 family)
LQELTLTLATTRGTVAKAIVDYLYLVPKADTDGALVMRVAVAATATHTFHDVHVNVHATVADVAMNWNCIVVLSKLT